MTPDDLVERVAQAIYEHWQFAAQVPCVPNGNSLMQEKARDFAHAAIAIALEEINMKRNRAKCFAVLHKPTGRLFPQIASGSTYFDFYEEPDRRWKHKFVNPPRIFGARFLATRYITEYCKGYRNPESFASKCTYMDPPRPRNIDDFMVVEVTLSYDDTQSFKDSI